MDYTTQQRLTLQKCTNITKKSKPQEVCQWLKEYLQATIPGAKILESYSNRSYECTQVLNIAMPDEQSYWVVFVTKSTIVRYGKNCLLVYHLSQRINFSDAENDTRFTDFAHAYEYLCTRSSHKVSSYNFPMSCEALVSQMQFHLYNKKENINKALQPFLDRCAAIDTDFFASMVAKRLTEYVSAAIPGATVREKIGYTTDPIHVLSISMPDYKNWVIFITNENIQKYGKSCLNVYHLRHAIDFVDAAAPELRSMPFHKAYEKLCAESPNLLEHDVDTMSCETLVNRMLFYLSK